MNILYRKLMSCMLMVVPVTVLAESRQVQPWYQEENGVIYYYIDTDTSPESMKKYMELQIKHGWSLDITGFSGKDGRITARFKRTATDLVPNSATPLPNSPSWFNKILRGSLVSYSYSKGVQEAYNHFQTLSKKGYEMGLMKQPLGDMKNVTITYYRAK